MRSKQQTACNASQDPQPQPALPEHRWKTGPHRHRQTNVKADWAAYEQFKSTLAAKPMLPDEYEAAIRVLVRRLGL